MLGKLSIQTELFIIYLIPRCFLALSHSKWPVDKGRSLRLMLNSKTLVRSTSSAVHVYMLCWGLRMYLSVQNIRASSTNKYIRMYLSVQNIRASSTNKYIRMYLSVQNIRPSSTDPGTITITESATLTHSPNLSCASEREASLTLFGERGVRGGGCAGKPF
jgi:hypothetical protein